MDDELLIKIRDMFEEKIEEIKSEVKEVKQYSGVLAEKLHGDIKLIAEGHMLLNWKLDELKQDVGRLNQEIGKIRWDNKINSTRLEELSGKVDRHEKILQSKSS